MASPEEVQNSDEKDGEVELSGLTPEHYQRGAENLAEVLVPGTKSGVFLQNSESIELAASIREFLRRCDEAEATDDQILTLIVRGLISCAKKSVASDGALPPDVVRCIDRLTTTHREEAAAAIASRKKSLNSAFKKGHHRPVSKPAY